MNAQAVTISGIFLRLYYMATAVFLVLDYVSESMPVSLHWRHSPFGVRFIMSSVSLA